MWPLTVVGGLYSRSGVFDFSMKTKSRDLKTFIFHLQRAYRGHPLSKRLANSSWKGLICDVNLISLQFKVMRMGKERILFAGK